MIGRVQSVDRRDGLCQGRTDGARWCGRFVNVLSRAGLTEGHLWRPGERSGKNGAGLTAGSSCPGGETGIARPDRTSTVGR
ncbi:hypothetical protein GCM10018790_17150 [Kitasatospora xanthocidica]|nr:hypothetical protein GCM10018790_17150 [Kitasatospora xanthocidica]